MRRINFYIYQRKQWPNFTWNHETILGLLSEVRHMQGKVTGKMEALGFALRNEASLETLTLDVLKTSEIEGEILRPDQVRSSLARKLGLNIAGLVPSDRHVDSVVEMMLDATQHYNKTISFKRLALWHAALFPTGASGMYKILVSKLRDDSTGPMQVVSGPLGKERVHFQAPDALVLKKELNYYLKWLNTNHQTDLVLKAALAHLWFVTLHPFEDGNGRIARAITDLLLARSDGMSHRFYSMSAQIRVERKGYYDILEKTQKGTLDVTEWIVWFLHCLLHALKASDTLLTKVLNKHRFWNKHATSLFNSRQLKMVNKLLDGIFGNLNSSKWAKMSKCSADTALRDIHDLIEKGILVKNKAGGRSTQYELKKV